MNIYVGNLSRDVSETDLKEAFQALGEVASGVDADINSPTHGDMIRIGDMNQILLNLLSYPPILVVRVP